MAREYSRDRRREREFDDRPRRNFQNRKSPRRERDFDDRRRERDFDDRPRRNFQGRGARRRDTEKTKVTCSECKKECTVPFKPKTSKPIYCDDCFAKKDPKNSNDIINEKLDKIMKSLKIE